MSHVFHIAPASVRPLWFVLPVLILVIVVGTAGVIMGASIRGARSTTFELPDGGLRLPLPGYRSGWFRLANGEKALVYVTDPSRVVHVPTTAGYSLLLSVTETDEFLDQLHAMSGARTATVGPPR